MKIPTFLRSPFFWIPAAGITYILVAGMTRFCPLCKRVTDAVGLGGGDEIRVTSDDPLVGTQIDSEWKALDLQGKSVSFDRFKDKLVLYDFWATWCPPCRAMVPVLNELQESYSDRGFEVVAFSMDQNGPEPVVEFNRKHNVIYTSLMGNPGLYKTFGEVPFLPTSFLVSPDGEILSRHVGVVGQKKLEQEIEDALARMESTP